MTVGVKPPYGPEREHGCSQRVKSFRKKKRFFYSPGWGPGLYRGENVGGIIEACKTFPDEIA